MPRGTTSDNANEPSLQLLQKVECGKRHEGRKTCAMKCVSVGGEGSEDDGGG